MLHVFEEVDRGRYEVVSVAEDMGEKKEKEGETGESKFVVRTVLYLLIPYMCDL